MNNYDVEDLVMIVEQDEGVPANKPTNEDESNAKCSASGFVFSSQEGTKSKVWLDLSRKMG